jgi:hypothetical protein
VRFAEREGYALPSSFLFRWRGRVSCFECSRVRRGATHPLARFCFVNSEGEGVGVVRLPRAGVTLFRALFSSAGAGEFRGFVGGAGGGGGGAPPPRANRISSRCQPTFQGSNNLI